jgi:hypothetical protein
VAIPVSRSLGEHFKSGAWPERAAAAAAALDARLVADPD